MSSKISKKKKSLSEQNKKLKEELQTMQSQRSVMEAFTKWRIITYAWIIFLPPYGLYRIWSEESTFVRSERVMWTFMIIVYMLQFFRLILFS